MSGRNVALIATLAMLTAGAWIMLRGKQTPAEADALDMTDEFDTADTADYTADQPTEPISILATAENVLGSIAQQAAEAVDVATMGIFRLSNMRDVTSADIANTNVRALLAVIRRGEGTAGANGYRTLFGGELFSGYADHPRRRITRTMGGKPITSTAAGAYQFLSSTWDETARIMGLQDFSPASQDRAAVGRIAARGALADAKAGRLKQALAKIAKEWASMPGSPYGQPVITEQTARAVYASAGGTINA